MPSRVKLVTILLTLNYVVRVSECSRSPQETRQEEIEMTVAPGVGIHEHAHGSGNVTSENARPPAASRTDDDRVVADSGEPAPKTTRAPDDRGAHSKTGVKERDRPRFKKQKMDRTMLALLMAYKLKFITLIPTLIGGLMMLKGTTLLAGFFFALFAAVLGLKAH